MLNNADWAIAGFKQRVSKLESLVCVEQDYRLHSGDDNAQAIPSFPGAIPQKQKDHRLDGNYKINVLKICSVVYVKFLFLIISLV